MTPNERGHYPIEPMEVELGLWSGTYQNQTQKWLRWWDNQGNLLLIGQEEAEKERAEKEKERAEKEKERAEKEKERAEKEKERAEKEKERAEKEKERAEKEKERAEKEQERQKREQLVAKLRSLSPEQLEAIGIDLASLE